MRLGTIVAAFALGFAPLSAGDIQDSGACAEAISRGAVCDAANHFALYSMRQRGLTAAIVVQDVRTGAIVSAAASRPEILDPKVELLPLSFMKVFLAASWWDRRLPGRTFDCIDKKAAVPRTVPMSIRELLVTGCDRPAQQMANALRRSIGGSAMIADLERFGIGQATLRANMSDAEWGDTWSIGENNVKTTLLDLSHFLQAVGNRGIALEPATRQASPSGRVTSSPRRMMQQQTATLLRSAFLDVVRRGTAKGSDADLTGTYWRIGGKTGSGPLRNGQELDGLFAGLIFDPSGNPRFTVASFVSRGGYGGGNAARLAARMARFLADSSGVQ